MFRYSTFCLDVVYHAVSLDVPNAPWPILDMFYAVLEALSYQDIYITSHCCINMLSLSRDVSCPSYLDIMNIVGKAGIEQHFINLKSSNRLYWLHSKFNLVNSMKVQYLQWATMRCSFYHVKCLTAFGKCHPSPFTENYCQTLILRQCCFLDDRVVLNTSSKVALRSCVVYHAYGVPASVTPLCRMLPSTNTCSCAFPVSIDNTSLSLSTECHSLASS